jgi:thymidylate synthase (FAD)
MKIVKQNAVLLSTAGIAPYEQIERIGRTCYKSEDKITEGSAVKFVLQMKKSRHYAMLEHYMVHMAIAKDKLDKGLAIKNVIDSHNKSEKKDIGSHIIWDDCQNIVYMSASFRSLLEVLEEIPVLRVSKLMTALNSTFPDLFPLSDDKAFDNDGYITIFDSDELFKADVFGRIADREEADRILKHHLTHTVLFTVDRGVSHEFVRHRPASFAQESTRYCNYSKGKFGQEITVIEPCFYTPGSGAYELWKKGCEHDEEIYFALINSDRKAQEARDNLPTSVKTDLIITATENEWQHIINLRYHGTTGAPHPQMKEVMAIAYPLLVADSENRLQ